MIYEVMSYNGEADMLECHLSTVSDVVDVVVIVEATLTFQGKPKRLAFPRQHDRFSRWLPQIEYVVPTNLPAGEDPWVREHACREWGRKGLEDRGISPSDIVVVCDVDEILRPATLTNLDPDGFQICHQSMRCFAVDWLHPDPWCGPVAARYRNLHDGLALARLRRLPGYQQNPAHVEHVMDAGWHLSWVGTDVERQTKFESFSHTEIRADLKRCYRDGIHVDGTLLQPTDASDLPAWVTAHAPKGWWRP